MRDSYDFSNGRETHNVERLALMEKGQMADDPNRILERLIDGWCNRRALGPQATVLPAWRANNGLTDGWAELRTAVRTAQSDDELSRDERELLRQVERTIDQVLDR